MKILIFVLQSVCTVLPNLLNVPLKSNRNANPFVLINPTYKCSNIVIQIWKSSFFFRIISYVYLCS